MLELFKYLAEYTIVVWAFNARVWCISSKQSFARSRFVPLRVLHGCSWCNPKPAALGAIWESELGALFTALKSSYTIISQISCGCSTFSLLYVDSKYDVIDLQYQCTQWIKLEYFSILCQAGMQKRETPLRRNSYWCQIKADLVLLNRHLYKLYAVLATLFHCSYHL